MIYTHVLNRGGRGVLSPADRLAGLVGNEGPNRGAVPDAERRATSRPGLERSETGGLRRSQHICPIFLRERL